ncbi:1-acyl-sn-glycerol-3-phosphate acyltransferase [Brevibacterium sediminis]|uniref:1-acyl-sn-glycerol-3-phosphate acyltransferase n=1 Tax=Brevibacterium sediminis TaxID=1857024 RepID=A0ABQ1LH65_9MICO|nr:1-acyl-sn-glycerol-3-phosphate acyltransferase [Brevibacterium sediminis]GGC23393.1 1-acyl-sn-glycerol-3-phosphate acyltransferase [Brevibacterium sediminis]
MIRRLLARAFWSFSKWNLVTEPAPNRPTILVGAPHTSNWDFVVMLAIAWRMRVDVHWLGKHSLFTGWRGPIMRGLGGIPVDRSEPSKIVTEVVDRMRDGEVFALVITPDGTRGGHTHWKSGFHRIAMATGMPVTLGYLDTATRTTGLGPTLEMTGDIAADMDRIREFYADKRGIRPHLQITPRLREEDSAGDDREGEAEPN